MINSNASKIKTYVGDDGKLHFVNSAGADTVLPFSSVANITYMEVICVCGWSDRNSNEAYATEVFRSVLYDTGNIGDQKLLSGSVYYSSGWKKSIKISANASGSKAFTYNATTPRHMYIWGTLAWI